MKSFLLSIPADSARGVTMLVDEPSEIAQEIAREDSMLMTIYFCGFLLALLGCAAIHFYYKKRQRSYADVINNQNKELLRHKLQSDSYGYILNALITPCCLVSEKGRLGWSNDAFVAFYGDGVKEFDMKGGAQSADDVEHVLTTKVPVSFFVKVKNIKGKTVGFKRTIVPLPSEADGTKIFAVVENVEL